jgi:hypothetical protein
MRAYSALRFYVSIIFSLTLLVVFVSVQPEQTVVSAQPAFDDLGENVRAGASSALSSMRQRSDDAALDTSRSPIAVQESGWRGISVNKAARGRAMRKISLRRGTRSFAVSANLPAKSPRPGGTLATVAVPQSLPFCRLFPSRHGS